ncbi:MAG: hypothetical protein OXU21_08375 [Chloroflexota bacterium]|nr:hypothetical protein [Chloroflexota bacterium]
MKGASFWSERQYKSEIDDEGVLNGIIAMLIDRVDHSDVAGNACISWSSPVPCFGDAERSRVATLGLNPSNREFEDELGNELTGPERRFHTLRSLGLDSWLDADSRHFDLMVETCRRYFSTNPYDLWFRKLDLVLEGANVSYYDPVHMACHLDLVPFATYSKWSGLSTQISSSLITGFGDVLGLVLRASTIQVLILNGMSVIRGFQEFTGVELEAEEAPAWTLSRRSRRAVTGIAYTGQVDRVGGIGLDREVRVLGFNHNLQGSFGVSRDTTDAIRSWIADECRHVAWL